jgi:hypothetical protein
VVAFLKQSFIIERAIVSSGQPQTQKSVIDFSQAIPDPVTGQLCVMQQVCIADIEGLSRNQYYIHFPRLA